MARNRDRFVADGVHERLLDRRPRSGFFPRRHLRDGRPNGCAYSHAGSDSYPICQNRSARFSFATQRNARAVCAVALFAIPYYFAAGIAVSGNAEIYANDRPIYATLVGTALLTAIVGFLPWRVRRSD